MGGNSRKDKRKLTLFEQYVTTKKEDSSEFLYESILENSMRYLNRTLHEAEKITLREYSYEMFAYNLRDIDKEKDIHLLAWQINQAQATKQKGKKTEAYFKTFKDFYDYEKRIKGLSGNEEKLDSFSKLMSKANS